MFSFDKRKLQLKTEILCLRKKQRLSNGRDAEIVHSNKSCARKESLAEKIHYDITFIVIRETFVICLLSRAFLFAA